MLCDDPKCPCHPRPKKPWQKVRMIIRGSEPGQFRQLDQPGSEIDVYFDLIDGTLVLRETVEDPEYQDTYYTLRLTIESQYMSFVNLKGLPDASLWFSFRIRSSGGIPNKRKMMMKQKYEGFSHIMPDSKLYTDFYECDWPKQTMEMILPKERIRSWRTAALILKTFNKINPENWCRIVGLDMKEIPTVAGLDWNALEKEIVEEREKVRKMKVKEARRAQYWEKENERRRIVFHEEMAALEPLYSCIVIEC